MHWLGATTNEMLFVALLVTLVLVAPKMPKIGERLEPIASSASAIRKPTPPTGDDG